VEAQGRAAARAAPGVRDPAIVNVERAAVERTGARYIVVPAVHSRGVLEVVHAVQ
jgi:hypothetical protein